MLTGIRTYPVAINNLFQSQSSDYGRWLNRTAAAVVLKQAEGKLLPIDRQEIEKLQVSKTSLMPEGVEKDIQLSEMAHLLEFLKNPRASSLE